MKKRVFAALVCAAVLAASMTAAATETATETATEAATEEVFEPAGLGDAPQELLDALPEGNASPVMTESLQSYAEYNDGSIEGAFVDMESMSEAAPEESGDRAASVGGEGIAEAEDDNRAIIGADDRWTVSSTGNYPYSAIAYMVCHARCGCTWTGSGFMVEKYVLMTASHCLVCTEHGQTVDQCDFYFGYQTNGGYYYRFSGQFNYWYGTSFPGGYTNNNMRWDYGVVRLSEDVGDVVGWFGMHQPSDSELNNGYYQVAGYRDGVLKAGYGSTEVSDSRLFATYADTLPGNSGCPVFDDSNYAIGINVASSNNGSANWGVRLNQEIFDKFYEYK